MAYLKIHPHIEKLEDILVYMDEDILEICIIEMKK